MNIAEVLLEKARRNELGHFYIIETSAAGVRAEAMLQNFVHTFIRDYYQKIEGHRQSLAHLMDHPDVFVLGSTGDQESGSDKFFKVEEAEGLARFFEFRPVQGKRKFAVITEGHRINPIVANKWLKLFEEPQGNSTIFLLNPRRVQLLSTIHSRAIHLRLSAPRQAEDLEEFKHFIREAKSLSLAAFLEKYSRAEPELPERVNQLIRWEALEGEQIISKQKLMLWLTDFQEMEMFHQPTATKWALFYSFLTENVFGRL